MTNFPESLEPLYSALGKVVYAWSFLENIVDICTDIVYHVHDGQSITYKGEMPRSFKNKLDFLKKSFKVIPSLNRFNQGILPLLDEADSLSIIRHDMIHSVCFHAYKDGRYYCEKFKYNKNSQDIQCFDFTINDYRYYGNKMMDLAKKFEQFATFLHYSHARP